MSLHRLAAILASTAGMAMLTAAPAVAQVPLDSGDSYPSAPDEQQNITSDPVCLSLANTALSTSTMVLTGIFESAAQCSFAPSLPQRRLVHVDLIQSVRDGR